MEKEYLLVASVVIGLICSIVGLIGSNPHKKMNMYSFLFVAGVSILSFSFLGGWLYLNKEIEQSSQITDLTDSIELVNPFIFSYEPSMEGDMSRGNMKIVAATFLKEGSSGEKFEYGIKLFSDQVFEVYQRNGANDVGLMLEKLKKERFYFSTKNSYESIIEIKIDDCGPMSNKSDKYRFYIKINSEKKEIVEHYSK